jgi:glutamate dehydrogenase
MGITARGAWECVKRHFRELGIDTQTHDFTVAGIGDMAGDVFGNGMLLSRHIRLLAAFNHQHIFLDPDPDAERSHAERLRLFRLPRSSWQDYDARAISRGGGVYERSSKAITLSAEAQRMLGVAMPSATPQEIIRSILRLPVDLLWNGGIGTYVKSAGESNLEAGDRANDSVRVDGRELRARVVGEGGNLGFTQRGRIEYALAGGRLNTDFIDNSAGVNTSDVEVNLKILLGGLERSGKLRRAARDRLLRSQTSGIAELVLRNNYLQSQALSIMQMSAEARLGEYQQLVRGLERTGELDRVIEFLPSEEEFAERSKRRLGLTRPELAVMLAYGKIWLSKHLLESDVAQDPYLSQELERYFPERVRHRFPAAIAHHRLRREIIVTATTNSLVNRMGPLFVASAGEETGAGPAQVARAYTIAREVFGMRRVWAGVEALDNRVPAQTQYRMMEATARLLSAASYGLLSGRRPLEVDRTVAVLRPGIESLGDSLESVLCGAERARFEAGRAAYVLEGVPHALAARVAGLLALEAGLDIVELARRHRTAVPQVARIWFRVGAGVGLDWLRERVDALAGEGPWQSVARSGLREGAARVQRTLAERALAAHGRGDAHSRVEQWMAGLGEELEKWLRTLAEMKAAGSADFATLSVGVEALRRLAEG